LVTKNFDIYRNARCYNNKKVVYFISIHAMENGKAVPLQAWTGPEGSRSLRLPDFKTIGP
jgi:hypothetical protein